MQQPEPIRMTALCPHCGENGLRLGLYGLECRCGWSPTVENCARCLCVGSCEGHLYGKSETKSREIRMCSECSIPVAIGE